MKPVLLTRFIEQLGLSELVAGFLVAMPFVGLACAAVCARWFMNRFAYRELLWLFSGTLVGCELICALFYKDTGIILAAQLIAGISVGVLMGLMSRLITQQTAADQMFGFVDMIAVLLMSIMIALVGQAVAWLGLQGGYLCAAAISAALVVIMLSARVQETAVASLPSVAESTQTLKLTINVRTIATVTMGVLFVTSSGMGFSFMFTLAQNLDMDYATASRQIGFLLFVSAFACWLGGWCSGRFGPRRPLACAFVACGLGWHVAINTGSPQVFILALIPAVFALQFCFPIFLAISAALDRTGQWASVATPLLTSGFAWAAISAGLVVQQLGLAALGNLTIAGMLICLLLLLIANPQRSSAQA